MASLARRDRDIRALFGNLIGALIRIHGCGAKLSYAASLRYVLSSNALNIQINGEGPYTRIRAYRPTIRGALNFNLGKLERTRIHAWMDFSILLINCMPRARPLNFYPDYAANDLCH